MTDTVRMTDLSSAFIVTGPVITGTVLTLSKRPTIWSSTCQHIVQIRHWVTNPVYLISFLCESECFEHIGAPLCFN